MNTRYRVEITEYTTETRTKGKEWAQGASLEEDDGKGNWGYTPEVEKKVSIETKVYEQSIESLDLKRVIQAINGI